MSTRLSAPSPVFACLFVRHSLATLAALSLAALTGCDEATPVEASATEPPGAAAPGDDLMLGDVVEPDLKADGWGHALECKPLPDVPPLTAPEIFVSIDGLTLRLVDDATGYERVFPIGPGARDTDPTSTTFGESLSYFPVLNTGRSEFAITPQTIQWCKTWWTDAATGARSPVFAGLPFLSWHGNYGIHGPIDNYTAASGGTLRRGYVSHGCLRMEAADVLEVAARIKGVARIPVHVQREAERREDGSRVDVGGEPTARWQKWIGSECASDEECAFDGGVCKTNPYGGRGFCTRACERGCPDRAGLPVTFCVADPDDETRGMCVNKHTGVNATCRPYDHFVPATLPRFGQSTVTADVCVPGSPGFIGDRCFSDDECREGLTCGGADPARGGAGICTQACTRLCPDAPGFPTTTCVTDAAGAASCARRCDASAHAPECAGDQVCTPVQRAARPDQTADVCRPE
jgi:hypothetical protein